jgi:hypothetical protein
MADCFEEIELAGVADGQLAPELVGTRVFRVVCR